MTLIADITDTAIDSIVEGLETRSHAPMVTIQMQRVIRVVVACTASLPCCTAELVIFLSFRRSEDSTGTYNSFKRFSIPVATVL